MKIHHIGYLVDNIETAAQEFAGLGFHPAGEAVMDSSRELLIMFLENQGYRVELIQSAGDSSSVHGLLKTRRNSPYHICYETDNLQREIDSRIHSEEGSSNRGYLLLQPPRSAVAIPGCPDVAFLMSPYVGMIELVEVPRHV